MDPEETLRLIRAACERGDDATAADWFKDLDEWLRKGGFLPREWQHATDDESACEGHESLAGKHMGETVYCDGSCQPAQKRPPLNGAKLVGAFAVSDREWMVVVERPGVTNDAYVSAWVNTLDDPEWTLGNYHNTFRKALAGALERIGYHD